MPTIDLRCGNNLYGRLTDNRWLEVKCKRRACGYVKGMLILHTIDITTGKVVKTQKFKEPPTRKEGAPDASRQPRNPVRSP